MRRHGFVLLLLLLAACSDGQRFSPGAWAATDPSERSALTDDLVKRRVLIGKHGREVNEMLGGARGRSTDSATWFVGVDEHDRPLVLEVVYQDDTVVRAWVHVE